MPRTELFITLLNTAEMEQSFWEREFKGSLFGFLSVAFLRLFSLSQFVSTPSVHTFYEHLIPQLRPTPAVTKLPYHQLLPLTLHCPEELLWPENQHNMAPAPGSLNCKTKVAFCGNAFIFFLGAWINPIVGLDKHIHQCGTEERVSFPSQMISDWKGTE